jgi:hypothetical protein
LGSRGKDNNINNFNKINFIFLLSNNRSSLRSNNVS